MWYARHRHMGKQYWRASVWSPAKTKVHGEYGLWHDEAGIQKYAAKMLGWHPQASYACWESQTNPAHSGCTGKVPAAPSAPTAPALKIPPRRFSGGRLAAPYRPPTIAGLGCGCAAVGIGEADTGGRALGVAAFVGLGLLAAGLLWLGTRGE